MELVQFDPFSLLRDMERMFDKGTRTQAWLPRIDVFDTEDRLVVRVEIPGVDPDAIDVTVEDRTLTVSGARSFTEEQEDRGYHRREIFTGEFRRTIVLPEGMNPEEIGASANNGILEISVPRRPEVLPRKVKVDVTG